MKVFVRVAPLRRLPTAMSVFDYEWISTETPHVGALIDIPFRKTMLPAIIIAVLPNSTYKTRGIAPVQQIPLIGNEELAWLMRTSETYQISIGLLCERMLPPYNIRARAALVRTKWDTATHVPTLNYVWYKNPTQLRESLLQINTSRTGARLVLTYSNEHAQELYKMLHTECDDVFLFDAESDPKQRDAWNALVGSGALPNPIIIGTQRILWLPHRKDCTWIFVEPTHEAHAAHDEVPYTNNDILRDRSKMFGEPIYCIAHSPDTADLNAPVHIPIMDHWPTIIDRTTDDPKNRHALFSTSTEEYIAQMPRVLIFVQHLKEATHVICADCGRMVRTNEAVGAICDACGSIRYIHWGLGGARIQSLLKKHDSYARDFLLLDAKRIAAPQEQLHTDDKPVVVIATAPLFDRVPLASFDLIVDLASDIDFAFPVHNTEERVWKRLRALASRLPASWRGTWIIETRHPERLAWGVRDLAGYTAWWNAEKPLRQRFLQPPFGPLKKSEK